MSPQPIDLTSPAAWVGVRAPVAEATGLDPVLYTDPEVHRLELERVFERSWICIGLAAEARTPGTVLVRTVGRRSILVTVDADGARHGHLNSCRHRGTELASADCTVRGTIRCPYHRWGYALDGSLISTPSFDQTTRASFERDAFGLAPVRVAAAAGLLFACLDPNTPSLDVWLGDLPDRLAGYDLDRWAAADSVTVEIAANWKLISENFQEYYHLPWVHPQLATVSRVDDHYRYQGPGMYCGQTTTPVSDGDGSTWLSLPPKRGLDGSDAVSGRHIAIFPNVIVSILPNHAFVARLAPDGPGRTVETCVWLLPPDAESFAGGHQCIGDGQDPTARAASIATVRDFWLDVNGEDIAIVERSQRGLTAGVPPGPLVPRFEEPLNRFHRMLAELFIAERPLAAGVPPGDEPGSDERLGGRANPNPPASISEAT